MRLRKQSLAVKTPRGGGVVVEMEAPGRRPLTVSFLAFSVWSSKFIYPDI